MMNSLKKSVSSKEFGLFALLAVLCLFVTWQNPRFLSSENLQNTSRLIGMYGIFSIGLGFVIITGGIDLSVGSAMALFGVLLSVFMNDKGWNFESSLLLMVLLAVFIGSFHGVLITKARMQPFIVTLCGLLLYRGLAQLAAKEETKSFGQVANFDTLQKVATGPLLGVPMPFWLLLIVAAVTWVLLHRSVYGRHLFAVGSNEEAALYSGIDTRRVIAIAYIICAVLTAISGTLFVFYTPSISPSDHASFFELYGIAAAVLGGCSLRGGEGSIVGILLGTALLLVLRNLVNLLSIPSSLETSIIGVVILLGVLADQLLKRRINVRA
jgi:ribose transport system permease protein